MNQFVKVRKEYEFVCSRCIKNSHKYIGRTKIVADSLAAAKNKLRWSNTLLNLNDDPYFDSEFPQFCWSMGRDGSPICPLCNHELWEPRANI